jgi:nicotinate-nucleotide pyrophosphorylase (carboxylating)
LLCTAAATAWADVAGSSIGLSHNSASSRLGSWAVSRARARIKPGVKVEVEVTNFAQAREALEAGADMIMLDNMSGPVMRKIIDWASGRVSIEISGGVTLKSVRRIALLGPDFISVGGLTHSSRAIDISLEFLK